MSWEKMKLNDVCISISDGDHQPPPKANKGVPFVTISNITNTNQFDFSNTMFVPQEYYDGLDSKRKVQEGDVLYSVVGSFGIPVYIKHNTPFVFQRHIAILRPNVYKISPPFLYYTMLNRDFYLKADAAAIGAAQRTVSLTALRNMEIEIPHIETQKKISKILSSYDNLIDNNQKQIKLLEEAAQRQYKEWFVALRFPGYENVKIIDGVPEGWELKPLSDIFKYVRGKSYTSKEIVELGGTLMVNLKNIKPFGSYNRNAEKRFDGNYKDSQKLNAGDLIMGVTDMTQERRLVGHIAIVPDMGETMTFSMDLIKLVPLSVKKSFIYATMYFGGYSKKISPLANGVNVLHLKPEAMMNMKMLIPTEEVIEQYDKIFEVYQKQIEVLQKQCDFATEARDRLLPKLMSGEREVWA